MRTVILTFSGFRQDNLECEIGILFCVVGRSERSRRDHGARQELWRFRRCSD